MKPPRELSGREIIAFENSALLFQVAGVSARNSFTHGLKHAELVGAAERNDRPEARRTKSARAQKVNPAKRGHATSH
jgi:hypothetical protein